MTRDQFVNFLATKLYENKNGEIIRFADGSSITEELLTKMLDAMQERR